MIYILSGILLGLASSLHCAGMCGPILLSLPFNFGKNRIASFLLYHFSRVIMYGSLGIVVGFVGEQFASNGFQRVLSIVSGVILILLFLLPSIRNFLERKLMKPFSKFKSFVIPKSNKQSKLFPVVMGGLNAFLPCGMVYMALAAALGGGSVLNSFSFMIFFGLGTIPLLATLSFSYQSLVKKLKVNVFRYVKYGTLILGIFFILRGMNLGIPFLSPEVLDGPTQKVNCH